MEQQVFYTEVKAVEKAMDLVKDGFKLGGELAKQVIIFAIDKAKENEANKSGLISLKELLKSEDGISSFTVNTELSKSLGESLEKMGVKFAVLDNKDTNEKRIFVEDKKLPLVKAAMEDILKAEEYKAEEKNVQDKIVANIDEQNFDFKDVDDEKINYRHKINNIDKELALLLKNELLNNNINSEMVVTKINEDESLNIDYKVKLEDKEKCIEVVNRYIDRFTKVRQENSSNKVSDILKKAKRKATSINSKTKKKEVKKEAVGLER